MTSVTLPELLELVGRTPGPWRVGIGWVRGPSGEKLIDVGDGGITPELADGIVAIVNHAPGLLRGLAAENERLREALQQIADLCEFTSTEVSPRANVQKIARAALQEKAE